MHSAKKNRMQLCWCCCTEYEQYKYDCRLFTLCRLVFYYLEDKLGKLYYPARVANITAAATENFNSTMNNDFLKP